MGTREVRDRRAGARSVYKTFWKYWTLSDNLEIRWISPKKAATRSGSVSEERDVQLATESISNKQHKEMSKNVCLFLSGKEAN